MEFTGLTALWAVLYGGATYLLGFTLGYVYARSRGRGSSQPEDRAECNDYARRLAATDDSWRLLSIERDEARAALERCCAALDNALSLYSLGIDVGFYERIDPAYVAVQRAKARAIWEAGMDAIQDAPAPPAGEKGR